jgi:hypothetical protein
MRAQCGCNMNMTRWRGFPLNFKGFQRYRHALPMPPSRRARLFRYQQGVFIPGSRWVVIVPQLDGRSRSAFYVTGDVGLTDVARVIPRCESARRANDRTDCRPGSIRSRSLDIKSRVPASRRLIRLGQRLALASSWPRFWEGEAPAEQAWVKRLAGRLGLPATYDGMQHQNSHESARYQIAGYSERGDPPCNPLAGIST